VSASVLIAGIGNIFHGDDAFGVVVVQKLATCKWPESVRARVRVMDIGIRAIDLAFALLDEPELTILVDTTARGGEPGTLYTIEIGERDVPDLREQGELVNSHGLHPAYVLALAKSMGARLRRVLLVGCEPLELEQDESGRIGLSGVVEAAVGRAIGMIEDLVNEAEVCHESV
jgi:hydrogenase maturation protease